jgi:8-oxo-dGTP pyrophosphatase MutT (NUDIX family)
LDILRRGWTKEVCKHLHRGSNQTHWAAVAIIIRKGKKEEELLLVKRAIISDDPWSGDMALPGGKKSMHDRNLYDTIRRETLEETNIDLRQGEYLGNLPTAYSNIDPNKGILPMIFFLDDLPMVRLNEEHTDYRWVTINKLKESRDIAYDLEGPIFEINEDDIVWGLTYRILDKFIEILDKINQS